MSLHFTFRRIPSTEALKTKITTKVEKLKKLVTYPMEVHVTLSLEKALHCAEITCYAEHRTLVAIAKTKDLYESIEAAVNKCAAQLRKEREKKKGHSTAHLAQRPVSLKQGADVALDVPHREKRIPRA